MRIDGITHTPFQAKIILAEKNNALIKKAIVSSFNHEHLRGKLDEIYKYQPKTTLLVQMEKLAEPKYGATHEITITNQNNAQVIKDTWSEKGVFVWGLGQLIEKLTDLRDELVYEFWNKPAIEKRYTPGILKHEIFSDECDFDYDKYLSECEQKEAVQKLSNKLEDTSSSLDEMIRDYEYDKRNTQFQDRHFERTQNNYYPSLDNKESETWSEIRRVRELREKYPQLYSEKDDENRAVWTATMWRNCNK